MNNYEITVDKNDLRKLFLTLVSLSLEHSNHLKNKTIPNNESLEKQMIQSYESYKNFIVYFKDDYEKLKGK